MSEQVAIIGNGWVGKSMHDMFPKAVVYDEPQTLRNLQVGSERYFDSQTAVTAGRTAVNGCEVAFVCVPTPNREDGALDTSIVEEVVEWCESDLIVLRSTVNPGTTDTLRAKTDKRIAFQPEYLGETVAHPLLDQGERPFLVIGGEPADRRKLIETYQGVYNANTSIRQVSAAEAEVIKLSENRAIMFKVAQAQELYDACEAAGIDYYTVRDAVYGDDPRLNLWFTFVYPDSRGANSKCIPKDVKAWAAWAESTGYKPFITRALLEKNEEWINA